jgi:hypothetical protein
LRTDNSRGDSTFTKGMSQGLWQQKSTDATIKTVIDFVSSQGYKVSPWYPEMAMYGQRVHVPEHPTKNA